MRTYPLILVLGGASSGKSAFAEALFPAGRKIYLATAQAYDAEMAEKIRAHREMRGDGWDTVEDPLDPAGAMGAQAEGVPLLLDCATLWLSNILLADQDVAEAERALLSALDRRRGPVVVVSNETGLGIVPENALARRFRVAQGRLNQAIAAKATAAVAVMAGLPLALKGPLPGPLDPAP